MDKKDLSLLPAILQVNPGLKYAAKNRKWQGIPGIERASNGRLWVVWYSGGEDEGPDNYVIIKTSMDDGNTWSKPKLVIAPPGKVRAFDPVLWHDPLGKLWLFWAQSYDFFDGRAGVWAVHCRDSAKANPLWSEPKRLCDGVMMNKPTVLTTGEWILPAAIWPGKHPKIEEETRKANAIFSVDEGKTWARRGGVDIPKRSFDEHTVIERRDRTLWMLIRTEYGIGESISKDRGFTWTEGRPSSIKHVASRFFIRRLHSGRLLLIKHDTSKTNTRSHLTAFLSDDDGKTWIGKLLIDERSEVSYPDGIETKDGRIYVSYDRSRHNYKEILMAIFTEKDIMAGNYANKRSRLKVVVDKALHSADIFFRSSEHPAVAPNSDLR